MKRLVFLLLCSVGIASLCQALTLRECVLGGRLPYGVGAMATSQLGDYFFRMNNAGTTVYKTDYLTGETSDFYSGTEGWEDFEVTADERFILFYREKQPIYRYSFSADYYVWDVAKSRLTKLSEDGGEEIATLSPDGKRVAYVKDNNVWVRDLHEGTATQVTTDGKRGSIIYGVPDWVYQEELSMLSSLRWSTDGKRLAFVRWDETEVPMASMTLYQGVCNRNDDYAQHPGRYDFKYPMAGEKNSEVSVWLYDVERAALRQVPVPLDVEDYVCHITFTPNASQLMVQRLNRLQNHLRIYSIDCTNDAVTQVYDEQSSTWVSSKGAQEVHYFADGFVIPSERDGYMQLYHYDYSGKLIRQLTNDRNSIITKVYGCDPAGKVFYCQATCGPLNRVLLSVDLAGNVKRLAPSTADGHGTASARFSGNFRYYIGIYSDARTPTQYRVYNAKGKAVRDLELNEQYAERYTAADVPRREFFTIENAGYQLNGYIIKPVDFDPTKKYPVIMEHYNGPGSQEVLDKWSIGWQQYFATQGYIIVNVDSRGTGARGKAFESLTYMQLGKLETEDAVAAANYMAAQPYVDADRIGIMGWSYGGFQTLMAMSEPGSNYRCGVAIAPVTTWRYYDTIYTERYMRTPQLNPEGYSNFPLNRIDNLHGRVLIMFGSNDDNVHIVNSMQYVAELVDRNITCDMMVFPGMNHSINGCESRFVVYQRALEFYNQYLK